MSDASEITPQGPPPPEGGLKKRALKGSAMTVASLGGKNLLRLASNLVLTRLLFPEAFGLMALMQAILTGLKLFSDLGEQTSIMRSPRGDETGFLNTAWTIQIARGIILYVILLLALPSIAAFYEEPQLQVFMPLAALTLVISGFNSTKIATAARHMQLGRLTVMELAVQLVALCIMAALAWYLRSIWALVIGTLVQAVLLAICSHLYLKGIHNRLHVDRSAFSELFNFGKYIFISTIAGFLLNHADKAVLGKMVPLEVLAIFTIGTLFASFPNQLNDALVRRIMLPLYTKRPPAESRKNARQTSKARWGINLVLVTAAGLLAMIGDQMVRFMYDARYESAGAILVLVAIGSMPVIIFRSYSRLPVAAGDSHRFALQQIATALLQFGILIWAVGRYGVVGAAFAPAAAAFLSYPLLVVLVRRYKGMDFTHDAVMLVYAAVLATLALWLNMDPVMALLNETAPAAAATG